MQGEPELALGDAPCHPLPAAAPGLAGDLCDSPLPIWWSLSPVAHDRPQVSEQQLLKDRTEEAWQSYFMVKCAEVPGGAAQGCSTRLRTRFQRGRPKSRNSPRQLNPGRHVGRSRASGWGSSAAFSLHSCFHKEPREGCAPATLPPEGDALACLAAGTLEPPPPGQGLVCPQVTHGLGSQTTSDNPESGSSPGRRAPRDPTL